jgi:hypothetical protein
MGGIRPPILLLGHPQAGTRSPSSGTNHTHDPLSWVPRGGWLVVLVLLPRATQDTTIARFGVNDGSASGKHTGVLLGIYFYGKTEKTFHPQ